MPECDGDRAIAHRNMKNCRRRTDMAKLRQPNLGVKESSPARWIVRSSFDIEPPQFAATV